MTWPTLHDRLKATLAHIPGARPLWAKLHPAPVPAPRECEPFPAQVWDGQYAREDWAGLPAEVARYTLVSRCVAEAIRPGGTVLDVGCGPGTLLPYLWPLPYVCYVGIDHSSVAIRQARAACVDLRAKFVVSDVRTYEPSKPCDVVVFNEVLYYLPEPLAVLRQYAAWLRPGGACVVSLYQGTERGWELSRLLHADPAWCVQRLERTMMNCARGAVAWECLVVRPREEG